MLHCRCEWVRWLRQLCIETNRFCHKCNTIQRYLCIRTFRVLRARLGQWNLGPRMEPCLVGWLVVKCLVAHVSVGPGLSHPPKIKWNRHPLVPKPTSLRGQCQSANRQMQIFCSKNFNRTRCNYFSTASVPYQHTLAQSQSGCSWGSKTLFSFREKSYY